MRSSWLLPALALTSGASALAYETIWLRWFRLLFGSTAQAAAATLAAFFLGLAIGSWFFARRAHRSDRPLRTYAFVEVGAAGTALLVPFVIAAYDPLYAALYAGLADDRSLFVALKFALAFAAMLPTTLLLGGTLPLLIAHHVREGDDLGRQGGWLYTTNTLGAALGTVAGALWLPEVLGIRGTYAVAVGGSLLAAALAFAGATRVAAATRTARPAERAPAGLLWIAGASGFGTLAFEVLLFHLLSMTLRSSVHSIGAVLLVVLVSLAAAAAFVAATAGRLDARRLLGFALAAEAVGLALLPFFVFAATDGLQATRVETLANGLWTAALFGGPALLVGGLVFPLTLRLASGGAPGSRAGGLLAANTLGGILGSLAGSWLLLDRLGLWPSMTLLAAGYALAALCPGPATARVRRGVALLVGLAGIGAWLGSPAALPAVGAPEGERLLAVHESAHGTLAVVEQANGNRWLKIDQYYGLASSAGSPRQQRWGHVALLLHPDPRRVLFVGSATGGTAASAVPHPVDEIVLVEIVPAVHDLARRFFAPYNRSIHSDPRTRLVVEDGRNHLRATRERYDVIVADQFVPARPGTGSMYSREHFRAVRERLTPDGVFAQWLPLYQMTDADFAIVAAGFREVFPNATLWRGDYSAATPSGGLIGLRGDPPTGADVAARIASLPDAARDRWLATPEAFWMLYVGPLALLPGLERAPPNTDDRPSFEFVAGRATAEQRSDFTARGWPRLGDALVQATSQGDPAFPGAPRASVEAGAALARANRLALEGKRAEALRVQREHVPPALLHPPDPTIGEFWPGRAVPDEGPAG
ncbi:MAG: spermidine synthase [Myxococcota bacterium]